MRVLIGKVVSTPLGVFWLSVASVLFAGLVGPLVVPKLNHDGGFGRYGWNIDLAEWSNIRGKKGDQPLPNTNIKYSEGGQVHKMFWLNTGQSLTFLHISGSKGASFMCHVRIHPEWNAGSPIEKLIFRATVKDKQKETVFDLAVGGSRIEAGEWKQLTFDLAPFFGEDVSIEIKPVSKQAGIWTLWRDPNIFVKN